MQRRQVFATIDSGNKVFRINYLAILLESEKSFQCSVEKLRVAAFLVVSAGIERTRPGQRQ